MGYLNRMGFFDHLAKEVIVLPERPSFSAAQAHFGANSHLVEIARIAKDHVDRNLPTRLAEAVRNACSARSDVEELQKAAWFIFAELVGNVEEHSSTALDGFAALQVYSGGNKLVVAVSDSELEIMETLRPSLKSEFPQLASLSDADLLVEVFKSGISRFGATGMWIERLRRKSNSISSRLGCPPSAATRDVDAERIRLRKSLLVRAASRSYGAPIYHSVSSSLDAADKF